MSSAARSSRARAASRARVVTPAAVKEVALSLFAERGYHGTALSEIAQRLGITTPGLYNHMRSKQELLTEIVLDTVRQVWADFEQAAAGVPPGAGVDAELRAVVYVYALRHATHRREALIVNRDSRWVDVDAYPEVQKLRRQHERAVRSLVERGIVGGVFADQPASLVSFGILEMCVSVARWFSEDGEFSAGEVAEQYAGYAVRMATGAGLAVNR